MEKLNIIGEKCETHCIAEWCRIYNIYRTTYQSRIKRGMTPE